MIGGTLLSVLPVRPHGAGGLASRRLTSAPNQPAKRGPHRSAPAAKDNGARLLKAKAKPRRPDAGTANRRKRNDADHEGIVVTTRPIRYHKEKAKDENGNVVLLPYGAPKMITVPHEKGIDVRLALDLVSLARKKQFDVALIFSQDQDLQEVVQEIWDIAKEQDRWIKIACAFPKGQTRHRVGKLIRPTGAGLL
jgi:hypothetical protein